MRSQIGGPKAMPPVDLRRLPGRSHSVAKQASFNIAFWTHFSGLGRLKSMPKFDLRAFFFDVIFESVLTSKFYRFLEARNQKNNNFLKENNDCHKISFFDNDPKKHWNFIPFSEARAKKILIKIDFKIHCFLASHFQLFFLDFTSVLEAKDD